MQPIGGRNCIDSVPIVLVVAVSSGSLSSTTTAHAKKEAISIGWCHHKMPRLIGIRRHWGRTLYVLPDNPIHVVKCQISWWTVTSSSFPKLDRNAGCFLTRAVAFQVEHTCGSAIDQARDRPWRRSTASTPSVCFSVCGACRFSVGPAWQLIRSSLSERSTLVGRLGRKEKKVCVSIRQTSIPGHCPDLTPNLKDPEARKYHVPFPPSRVC